MPIPQTATPGVERPLPSKNRAVMERARAHLLQNYKQQPIVLERGQGTRVWDADGNVYLDLLGGIATLPFGHCHPEIVRTIEKQSKALIHICGADYYYPLMPELASKLSEIAPMRSPTRALFTNSGTETVECALKLAMYATGRNKFIAFFNSFHGRTLGSLSLTSSKAAQRRGFKRQALDVVHVPYPNEFRNPFSAADCGDGGAGQGAPGCPAPRAARPGRAGGRGVG